MKEYERKKLSLRERLEKEAAESEKIRVNKIQRNRKERE